jgi:hypothetical protein
MEKKTCADIDMPGAIFTTSVKAVSGKKIVGWYVDFSGKRHGFVYDIGEKKFTTLDMPAIPGASTK